MRFDETSLLSATAWLENMEEAEPSSARGGHDDGARGNGYKPLPDPVPFLGAGINYCGACLF